LLKAGAGILKIIQAGGGATSKVDVPASEFIYAVRKGNSLAKKDSIELKRLSIGAIKTGLKCLPHLSTK
jgi:hypothetical protein